MNASNDVTEALRRTIGLMQGELERSVLSSQMLGMFMPHNIRCPRDLRPVEQSSANLRSTTTVYDTLSTLLSTSKHLIAALEKSDWLDRLLILAAVAFFFLVVLFILKQRVVDKGIHFAFWWTRFIPDFHGDAALLKMERDEAGTLLTTTTATVLSTVSTIAATTVHPSSTPDSWRFVDSSTFLSSDSTSSTPGADDVEAIQELIQSTAVPSQPLEPHPTDLGNSMLQENKHQEL